MSAEKRDVLRRVRVFSGLSDPECDVLLDVLKARKGAPGDTLFRQDEPGSSLMIVLEGHLSVRVRTDAGTEEEVGSLGPGEVVGEMAFLDTEPRSATVSTPKGALVLDFTREALATLKQRAPRVAAAIQRNLLGDVARRLRDAGEKLADGARVSMTGAAAEPKKQSRGLTAQQLRSIPALASYGDEDIELLAYVATLRTFTSGEIVVREGTEGDACWLLVSGEVAVARTGHSDTLATLGPGALVGQLALLDRAPRSATITAVQETLALEVRANAFANLVASHTPIALRFQEQVALAGVRQLRAATKKVAENSARESMSGPMSGRVLEVDDWDDTTDRGPAIELAIDPKSIRGR